MSIYRIDDHVFSDGRITRAWWVRGDIKHTVWNMGTRWDSVNRIGTVIYYKTNLIFKLLGSIDAKFYTYKYEYV